MSTITGTLKALTKIKMKYKKKRIFKKKASCLKITRKRETSLICLKANEYSAKHA